MQFWCRWLKGKLATQRIQLGWHQISAFCASLWPQKGKVWRNLKHKMQWCPFPFVASSCCWKAAINQRYSQVTLTFKVRNMKKKTSQNIVSRLPWNPISQQMKPALRPQTVLLLHPASRGSLHTSASRGPSSESSLGSRYCGDEAGPVFGASVDSRHVYTVAAAEPRSLHR